MNGIRTMFLVTILFPLVVFSQAVKLSLTARYDDQYLIPDSIVVQNLTHPGDTVLFHPDTIFVLNNALGISSKDFDQDIEFETEGPMISSSANYTIIRLHRKSSSKCRIQVVSPKGQQIFLEDRHLQPGHYQFEIENEYHTLLLMTIQGEKQAETLKLLPTSGLHSDRFRVSMEEIPMSVPEDKVLLSTGGFRFFPHDTLQLICYGTPDSVAGSDVIISVPVIDDTITFHILQGLPCPGSPSVFYMGQVYRTVQIGQQCWMKDNLNAGVRIDYPDNPGISWAIEKYCFENLEENCTLFGGLYNWYEVVNNQTPPLTPPTRGICPEGWHLPTDAEWTELASFAGGQSIAARALKTVGSTLWLHPNDATNKSGFSALPGGSCFHYGFGSKGYQAAFWSADFKGYTFEFGPILWYMFSNSPILQHSTGSIGEEHSVRCVRD